jgi:hypothetical protein
MEAGMSRLLLACFLALCGGVGNATAFGAEYAAQPRVELPGIGLVSDFSVIDQATGLPDPQLIEAIGHWLTAELDLPDLRQPPAIAFASPAELVRLRLRGNSADPAPPIFNTTIKVGDVVALYDPGTRTIYLPEGWEGSTPAELSIVVHEMVHHLQNEAGQKAGCPEYLEGAAFDAQARWLALFGTDLDREFGLDAFTLLVRTNCPF